MRYFTKHSIIQFIKYFAAALAGATSDYFSFMEVHALSGSVVLSNFVAFVVGTTVNYFICRYFVFRSETYGLKGLVKLYVMTYGVVLLMTLYIGLSQDSIGLKLAKLSSFALSYALNFGIRKLFVFREQKNHE